MKRRLLSLLLAVSMLCSFGGCGEKETYSEASSQEETFGETISQAEPQIGVQPNTRPSTPGEFSMPCNNSQGWDPYACTSMENRAVMQLIYQGLFTMTPDFEAEPVLAGSFNVSEDGLTYTVKLQNAHFSSGDPVDSQDVVYSMGQAQNSTLYRSRFRDISSYEASAPDTVVIHMENANDRLPTLLDFPIVPRSGGSSPVGSGPFVRQDSALIKDPNWWMGADTVQFDRVELYSSISAEDTRDHFETSEVNFVYNNPMASTAASFHCDYELWNSRGTVMQYMGFNLTTGICQDQRIRAAILKAIDRAEIAESVYHYFADPAALPVAPTSSMYDEKLAGEYDYYPEQALEELLSSGSYFLPQDHPIRKNGPGAELEEDSLEEYLIEPEEPETEEPEETAPEGQEDGTEEDPEEGDQLGYNHIVMLVLSGNINRSAAARKAANCLEDVGFTVEIKTMDQDEYIYTINSGNAGNEGEYDLYFAEVSLTPDFDLRPILYSGGELNYSMIPEDTELRELYASALENSGNRYDLYKYIMDKAYICPILFENNAVFTSRGMFTGLDPAPGNAFYEIGSIVVQ